ncbi:hypothetical protein WR25_25827 [Diploscapter pachys]|uniref:Uncharacterized protein n=1 Tax=Diploscapter pachys TaxID=2018661 RepID=A0A2A2JLZ2_9BILA|nr:hypothetical protein WR25_25827 [Diploscapter pachys]
MDAADETTPALTTLLLYAGVIFGGLYFLRRWIKGRQFTERMSAKDKVAVVTGASAGIGLETVRELNYRKAKVYMLCRNEDRANEAKRKLVGCDPTRLIFVQCDLSSFESIREAAREITQAEQVIDILINNAGIMFYPKFEKTVDGHEMTWQSNYLGHFLLTELLLPALKRAQHGRIINVSSKLHHKSKKIDLTTVDDKKAFGMMQPYNRSKLANVMHAHELTKRLRKASVHNVTANSLHPGVIDSELSRHLPFVNKPLIRQIAKPITWFFMRTPKDGAQTTLYLALSKHVDGVSGKYFSDCKLEAENPVATDDAACEDLYNYSLEACGLQK